MYVFAVVCCCLCCLLLCCLSTLMCLFWFDFSCFQLYHMFLYRWITSITNITKHKTKITCGLLLLLCVAVCDICFFVLFCYHVLCLFCFAFSFFQLCRVFLDRLITNIANITKHKKTSMFLLLFVVVCWCLCCLCLCCLLMLLCLLCIIVSCFQLCHMFLYRFITSITNITKHKTKTIMFVLLFGVGCTGCFFLCCVCIVLCVVCFAFSCFQLCRMFLYRLTTK